MPNHPLETARSRHAGEEAPVLAKAHLFSGSTGRCVAMLLLALSGFGCAESMDALLSRRFRNDPMHVMFGSDDPMYVLRHVEESDARVRAMQDLKEPLRNGKSQQDQDEIVQILAITARSDSHAVCRLAAIEALARFEDPRASQILVEAYHDAPYDAAQVAKSDDPNEVIQVKHAEKKRSLLTPGSTFTPDLVDQIQMHVLASLGRVRSPAGLALLCEVASNPGKKEATKSDSELFFLTGSEQGASDIRSAALRSLAFYKGEQAAIDVCYTILATDRTLGLRYRAHEALKQLTGKNAEPPDAAAWAAVLGKVEAPPVKKQ